MIVNHQRGSSTAEFAVLLPVVAAFLALVLGVGVCGSTQVRVEQAARAAARELARGEPAAHAVDTGHRLAGEGASVRIGSAGRYRKVEVTRTITLPWLSDREFLVLSAQAQARTEAGPGGPVGHDGR